MSRSTNRAGLSAAMLAIALLAGACGASAEADAGDELSSSSTDAVSPESTEAPNQAETTTTTATATTEEEYIDGPTEPAGQAFCDASQDFWIADEAKSHVDTSSPAQTALVFDAIEQRLAAAIAAAPSDEEAAPALEAQRFLTPVVAELARYGYDWEAFSSSPDLIAQEPNITAYDAIVERLEGFLASQCGVAVAALVPQAEALADGLATQAGDEQATTSPEPSDDAALAFRWAEDPSGRIRVQVPPAWTSEQTAPPGETTGLIVSTDAERLRTSWGVDGVQIDLADVDGAFDWRAPMYDTAAAGECTAVDSRPYSDELYTGWIDSYAQCPGGGVAFVVGATDAGQQFEILVQVQFDSENIDGDGDVLALILDSFQVR